MSAPHAFTETLAPGLLMQVEGELLAQGHSAFQHWEVWQTPAFGRLYRLDGRSMASERDSFLCHEALIHVGALARPTLRRALVLGGGDGASCAELLRYPQIEDIVLAELDPAVIGLARTHLASLHGGALDDARVRLCLGDAAEYVTRSEEAFDLIVFDLTDPDTAAAPLYSTAFFAACARRLTPLGAICLHLGSPVWQRGRIRELLGRLRSVFAQLSPVFGEVPLYGGPWMFAVASDAVPAGLAPEIVRQKLAALRTPLRLIDANQYHRLLACPPWLADLV